MVRRLEDTQKCLVKFRRVTQLYANDGATISGATIAAHLPDDRLLIGDIKHGLLRCAMTSV